MPPDKNQCPVCDRRFVTSLKLARHIMFDHLRERPPGIAYYVTCWCGREIDKVGQGKFLARHLRACGGATAHYLSCRLGVPRDAE